MYVVVFDGNAAQKRRSGWKDDEKKMMKRRRGEWIKWCGMDGKRAMGGFNKGEGEGTREPGNNQEGRARKRGWDEMGRWEQWDRLSEGCLCVHQIPRKERATPRRRCVPATANQSSVSPDGRKNDPERGDGRRGQVPSGQRQPALIHPSPAIE